MKVKIPIWAKEVKDENWIVFFWFLRSLTICYPPYGRKEDRVRKEYSGLSNRSIRRRERPVAIYHMLPKDVHTILGTRALLHEAIESWPDVAENFTLGIISNQSTRCTLKTWSNFHTVDLKKRRSKDMIIYLSGCLNHNLITDEPRTEFQINTALKGHFAWFRDEAEENGWHTES